MPATWGSAVRLSPHSSTMAHISRESEASALPGGHTWKGTHGSGILPVSQRQDPPRAPTQPRFCASCVVWLYQPKPQSHRVSSFLCAQLAMASTHSSHRHSTHRCQGEELGLLHDRWCWRWRRGCRMRAGSRRVRSPTSRRQPMRRCASPWVRLPFQYAMLMK